MRRESKAERAAWTAHFEGTQEKSPNKYHAQREGKYASKREAEVAARLGILHDRGLIRDLREQYRIELVPGRGKLRPIIYIADFRYADADGTIHILDAKGFKTPVYRLKKRLAALLLNLEIEEV